MSKKIYLIIIGLLISVLSAYNVQAKTYQSADLHLSFEYPDNWTIKENFPKVEVISPSERFKIHIRVTEAGDRTMDSIDDAFAQECRKWFCMERLPYYHSERNGVKLYMRVPYENAPIPHLVIKQYFLIKDRYFQIDINEPTEEFQNHIDYARPIMDSVTYFS